MRAINKECKRLLLTNNVNVLAGFNSDMSFLSINAIYCLLVFFINQIYTFSLFLVDFGEEMMTNKRLEFARG